MVPWFESGGLYALPNLRGGGEYGEEWHRAGMLEKKQNVFDDFVAAAEWLIAQGYTRPEKLAKLSILIEQALSGRLPLIHVKDVAADGDWAEVGYGAIDYRPIIAAAPSLGVEWLVVEQDTTHRPPLESVGMSIKWLRENT